MTNRKATANGTVAVWRGLAKKCGGRFWTIILMRPEVWMRFVEMASRALVLGAMWGCTRGAAMIELNEAAAGHPVTVEVGERLRVTLPENRTTGYRWQVGEDCARILAVEEDQSKPGSGAPGAGGERMWVFAAKAEGQCELRFESARAWEKSATGKTVSFPVAVKGK
jgi:predicted secreted protein